MAQTTPDPDQLVSDYEDLWNGDFSKLDAVSESVDIYDPVAPDGAVHGRDAFEAYLRELLTAFPDLTITVNDMLASDEVVLMEWTATGTHEGEFNNIPPTEREMEISGMSKTLIADGRVQEDRMYVDRQEMFEQLGLTEA